MDSGEGPKNRTGAVGVKGSKKATAGQESEQDECAMTPEQNPGSKAASRKGSKRKQNVVPSHDDEDDEATADAKPKTSKKGKLTKSSEVVRDQGQARLRDQDQDTDAAVDVEEPGDGKGKGKGRSKARTRPVPKRVHNTDPDEEGRIGAEEALIVPSPVEGSAKARPKPKRKAGSSGIDEDEKIPRDNIDHEVQDDDDGGPDNAPLPLRRASRFGNKASGSTEPSGEKLADTASTRKQSVEDRELLKTAKSWMADTPSRKKTRKVRFGEED